MPDLTQHMILAMKPGPTLRKRVAEMMGWKLGDKQNISPCGSKWSTHHDSWEGVPDYPFDMKAAMEVFDKFAPCASLYHHGPTTGGHYSVFANDKNNERRIHIKRPTAAHAICLAALLNKHQFQEQPQ